MISKPTPFDCVPADRPRKWLRHVLLLVAAMLCTLASTAVAQVPGRLLYSLYAPTGGYGAAVAVSGSWMVVGAPDSEMAFVYNLSSETPTVPAFILNNPSTGTTDSFGASVAISGTRVVVGAPTDSTGADGAGSAYVYNLSGATPTVPATTLRDPDPVDGDTFGASVGISGTRVVVGVPLEDTGAEDAGSVYVYDLSQATPAVPVKALRNPTPAVNDQFGTAVGISGALVVVGALADDTGAEDAGSAYVYNLIAAIPTVPVVTLSKPSPAASDLFGYAVAIDGTRVVVGAIGDDTGAVDTGSAYVYDVSSATPAVPVATLNDPNPMDNDRFGSAVSISDTRVVIGVPNADNSTGTACVYDIASEAPTSPVARLRRLGRSAGDSFAQAVAIDGTTVVIGTPKAVSATLDAGGVFVYVPATAPQPDVLSQSLPAVGREFGSSVALSGSLLVVGAPADDTAGAATGSASVYDLGSATPSVPILTLFKPIPAANDRFGIAVAISGTKVVVGAIGDVTGTIDAGSAFVYDLAGATPAVPIATLSNPTPDSGDFFGSAVAVSGNRVVVGAYSDDTGGANTGSAYAYDLSSDTPTVPLATLHQPDFASGANFGTAVAMDGAIAVVGASGDDFGADGAGSAYVYDLSNATPDVPIATLHNPTPDVNDRFGNAVGISGVRVVVAAIGDSTGASDAGSAYIYDLSSETPATPATTLNNPDPAVFGLFGATVAISGDRVAVGAPTDSGFNGSVCVYDLSGPSPTVPAITLLKPNAAAEDNFGISVTLDQTTLACGAPYDLTNPPYLGAVYVFGSTATPAIAVEQPVGKGLIDASATVNFGSVARGSSSTPITFTIRNVGVAQLSGLDVTEDGTNAGEFSVDTTGMLTMLGAGATTTFSITFSPSMASTAATRTAALHIVSNVTGSKSPFDVNLTGGAGFGSYFYARSIGTSLDVLAGRTGNTLTGLSAARGGTATIVDGKVWFVLTDLVHGGSFTFSGKDSHGDLYTETVSVVPPAVSAGSYVGLLMGPNGATRGYVSLTSNPDGVTTGGVRLDGAGPYTFRGNLVGRDSFVVTTRGGPILPIKVTPGESDGTGRVTLAFSMVSSTGEALTATLERAAYKAGNPAPASIIGRYTLAASLPDGAIGPATSAVFTCNVTSTGAATFTGRLGNGKAVTVGGTLVSNGHLPFYCGYLSGGKFVSLAGDMIFVSPQIGGSIRWTVPTGADPRASLPAGQDYNVFGANYRSASDGTGMFVPSAAQATLNLEIPSLHTIKSNVLALSGQTQREVQYIYSPNPIRGGARIDLIPRSGSFSGFYYVSNVKRPYYGVVLQLGGTQYGQGFLLDGTAVGEVSIVPVR